MARRTRPHVCIDRIVPLELKHHAAALAVEENRLNAPPRITLPGVTWSPMKMALVTGKRWSNGRTLGVRFLDGSQKMRDCVIEHASMWMKYANVTLHFDAGSDAEIRISFQADPGSWSAVGTDCLHEETFPRSEPTMNLGWLTDDTDEEECRRVTLHEFGHALGAIHEHQNPRSGIHWDEQAVLDYFSGPPNNWSEDEIRHNILDKYAVDQLNATKFDKKSIMLYYFPPEMVGGLVLPNNTDLSAGDKSFIRRMYPKTGPQKAMSIVELKPLRVAAGAR